LRHFWRDEAAKAGAPVNYGAVRPGVPVTGVFIDPSHPMATRPTSQPASELDKPEHVFEHAAELFRVLSAPMRLKIISCLCEGEQNVNYLLSKISTTQPNMSQHLNTLYKAGVLAKRRDGVQIYYRIANLQVVTVCKAVCYQVQLDTVDWVSP
jgi:ArsR family transcriptional regulator